MRETNSYGPPDNPTQLAKQLGMSYSTLKKDIVAGKIRCRRTPRGGGGFTNGT